jgi:NACalpha-BTF3-like transcription factor
MYKQQQRQLEEQALAKMMTQFDPKKLRAADQSEFLEKYNRLQNLYVQNRGLYRQPLKFPQAYREAQQLQNELMTMTAESKSTETFLSDFSKEAMRDRNKFSPESISAVQQWTSMPTSQIKKNLEEMGKGNRLPTFADLEFTPKPLDDEKMKKLVTAAAMSQNAISKKPEYLYPSKDNNIPRFEKREIYTEKIDPNAMPGIAQTLIAANPDLNQHYDYMNRHMTQDQRMSLQKLMDENFNGVKIDLNTPSGIATADLLSRYHILNTKIEDKPDTDAIKRHEDAMKREGWKRQEIRDAKKSAAADRRAMMSVGSPAQDMNYTHAQQFVGVAAKPGMSKTTFQAFEPFRKIPGYDRTLIHDPSIVKDYATFRNGVMLATQANAKAGQTNVDGSAFNINEEDIKSAWNTKTPIYTVSIKYTPQASSENPNPKSQTSLYNILPTKSGTPEAVATMWSFYGVGSKETGAGIGNPIYTQVINKKKYSQPSGKVAVENTSNAEMTDYEAMSSKKKN